MSLLIQAGFWEETPSSASNLQGLFLERIICIPLSLSGSIEVLAWGILQSLVCLSPESSGAVASSHLYLRYLTALFPIETNQIN